MGIRATLVIRLVVNADKYTQGRIALSYRPGPATLSSNFVKDHRIFTQLPHVELDLNTDTEVTLKIPHRGPYSHFDISNRLYNPGTFYVSELLAHRGSSYSYTVYSTFEDIDLIGPTGISFNATYEGNLEVEEKNVPLSQKVKELGSALTTMSTIPMLGSYISPLAWVTGITGSVMSAFGYSKPLTTVTPTVYLGRHRPKYNQCDGTDLAETLAVTTGASVRVSDQVGLTEMDEMSFNYLIGMKCTMQRLTFDTTTPVGTKIGQWALSPFQMMANGPLTDTWVMHPLAYVSNLFCNYRGSFSVTFELSKTIFHTGRLMVVFEPVPTNRTLGTTVGSRINTIEDAVNCHKDIIDVRKGNAFTFDLPFTSLVPYLPCEQAYGFVHLFVVNSLVRNDTAVDTTVDIAVKFAGNDDFEFQAPQEPRFYPVYADSTQAAFVPHTNNTLNITYESGLEVGDTCITRKPIGASVQATFNVDMSALCVGECLRSVKQIAMRSKQVYVPDGTNVNGINYNPFVVDRLVHNTLANPIYPLTADFYSYVGAMYAYARGGVIYTVDNRANQAGKIFSLVYDPNSRPPRDDCGEFNLSHSVARNSTDRIYIPPCDTSFVRHTYPTNSFGFFNRDNDANPPVEYSHDSSKAKFHITQDEGETFVVTGFALHRAGADDTQFGGFASIPLVTIRAPWSLSYTGGGPGTEYKLSTAVIPNS